MRVLVINPNTTAAMTDLVVDRLRQLLPADTELVPMTAQVGPAVVATQEAFDEAAMVGPTMLRSVGNVAARYDAVVLACFGDPGLEAMRACVTVPVVGLAHASMQQAEKLGTPYAIVSAGPAWRPMLTARLASWGASELFTGVDVPTVSGLEVLSDPAVALSAVLAALDAAHSRGARRVILGGAVFAGFREVMASHAVASDRIIDCVEAAARELKTISGTAR